MSDLLSDWVECDVACDLSCGVFPLDVVGYVSECYWCELTVG